MLCAGTLTRQRFPTVRLFARALILLSSPTPSSLSPLPPTQKAQTWIILPGDRLGNGEPFLPERGCIPCLLPRAKERIKTVCREQNAQTHRKATKRKKATETLKSEQNAPDSPASHRTDLPSEGSLAVCSLPGSPLLCKIQAGRGELRTRR